MELTDDTYFGDDSIIIFPHPTTLHYCPIRDPKVCSVCERIEQQQAEYAKTCSGCPEHPTKE